MSSQLCEESGLKGENLYSKLLYFCEMWIMDIQSFTTTFAVCWFLNVLRVLGEIFILLDNRKHKNHLKDMLVFVWFFKYDIVHGHSKIFRKRNINLRDVNI